MCVTYDTRLLICYAHQSFILINKIIYLSKKTYKIQSVIYVCSNSFNGSHHRMTPSSLKLCATDQCLGAVVDSLHNCARKPHSNMSQTLQRDGRTNGPMIKASWHENSNLPLVKECEGDTDWHVMNTERDGVSLLKGVLKRENKTAKSWKENVQLTDLQVLSTEIWHKEPQ